MRTVSTACHCWRVQESAEPERGSWLSPLQELYTIGFGDWSGRLCCAATVIPRRRARSDGQMSTKGQQVLVSEMQRRILLARLLPITGTSICFLYPHAVSIPILKAVKLTNRNMHNARNCFTARQSNPVSPRTRHTAWRRRST